MIIYPPVRARVPLRARLPRDFLHLAIVFLLVAVLVPSGFGPVLPTPEAEAAVPGVTQTYYLPMSTDDHLAALLGIGGAGASCCTGPMETFVSIVSGTNNNTIAIDHWEDGYDADPIAAPSSTTETYLRPAGGVVPFTQTIPVPRTPSPTERGGTDYFVDGRDKLVATGLAAVTMGGWAQSPGPFHAGAVAVYDSDKMGFSFEAPLGEDANSNLLFDYVGMFLIASEAATVEIDADANGVAETTIVLSEGQTHFVDGGVNLGATVESTGRIGAYLATGDASATYEGRFIELFPKEVWFDTYVSPVGSTVALSGRSRVYVYNPGPGAISVDYSTGGGNSGTLGPIAIDTRVEFELPDAEGTLFTSQGGEPFYATQMFGANTESSRYDWGFTLVPGQALTPVSIVPYGPGSRDRWDNSQPLTCAVDTNTSAGSGTPDGLPDCNYSPVWITPISATRVYIDHDADPATGAQSDPDGNKYDFHCDLTALQSRLIYADGSPTNNTSCYGIPSLTDPTSYPTLNAGPRDLTGTRIYTADGVDLATAWGQAPLYRGDPAIDLGTTVFPFPSVDLEKLTIHSIDVDGDGKVDPGDELTYQIFGTNNGLVAVSGITVIDDVPANTGYVPDSTALSFYNDLAVLTSGPTAIPDDGVGTLSPIDEGGYVLGSTLALQETFLLEFKVTVDSPIAVGVRLITNDVILNAAQGSFFDREITKLDVPPLQIQKSSDVAGVARSGDTITYTVQVANNDDAALSNVNVLDTLPVGITYVGSSTTLNAVGVPDDAGPASPFPIDEGGYTVGALGIGQVVTFVFQATVDTPMLASTTSLTNSATVTSTEYPTGHTDLVVDPVARRIDLVIGKTDAVDPVVAGGQISYVVTVTNNGPDQAGAINVTDTFPSGTSFNAPASDPACTDVAGDAVCTAPTLDVGAGNAITFTIVADVDPSTAGSVTNTVSVTATGTETAPGDESTTEDTFIEHPVVEVVKNTSTPSVDLATPAAYTYDVSIPTPGNVSLTGLSLIDDACSSPAYQSGDAGVAGTLEIGETWRYTCSTLLTGDTTNTATVTGTPPTGPDISDQDTAVVDVLPSITVTKSNDANGDVTFTDTEQAPSPGAVVTFQVEITNNTSDDVTITAMTDDLFTIAPASSCGLLVGTTLGASATVTCTFDGTAPATDNASATDTVSVTVQDTSSNTDTATDTSTVTVADILPSVTVTKSNDANGDVTFTDTEEAPLAGAAVTFQVEITNNTVEAVTIDSITDDLFTIAPASSCGLLVGTTLGASATVTCTFDGTAPATDNASATDTVSVVVSDNDANTLSPAATDTSTVTVADILPSVTVTKSNDANGDVTFTDTEEAPLAGAAVTFQVEITNNTVEAVTIDSITDDLFTIAPASSCGLLVGTTLGASATVTCTFDGTAPATDNASATDTVSVVVSDNDANTLSPAATDTSTVTVADILPSVTVTKSNDANGDVTFTDTEEAPLAGAAVTFQVEITNNTVEAVTIDSITDDLFTIAPASSCGLLVGTTLGASATVTCTFDGTAPATDNASATDTVSVVVSDNDANTLSPAATDTSTVTTADILPSITVAKSGSPNPIPEPGGDVTFTVTVENTSNDPVTLDTLTDSAFGNVFLLSGTTCSSGVTIQPGGVNVYSCTFTRTLSGNAGGPDHSNTVTAGVSDNDGNSTTAGDSETVPFTNVVPTLVVTKSGPATIPEPGGTVTFTVSVQNQSTFESVTLTSLTDSVFGDITMPLSNPLVSSSSCGLVAVGAGATYSCSFDADISGNAAATHVNTVTAVASDDDGSAPSANDSHTVTFTDVAPSIVVTKSPSVGSVAEPGGDVTYTISVENTGVESVTLTDLVDDRFGDVFLIGGTSCVDNTVILPGAVNAYSCTFVGTISQSASAGNHTNTVTATVQDDETNSTTDDGSATVNVTDVAPSLTVTKSAVATIPEPGGTVTFTVTVENTGVEPVTLTDLVDDRFGDVFLIGGTSCVDNTVILPGAVNAYSCTFDESVSGNAAATHVNTVTATVEDDESNTTTANDSHTVTFTDVAPSIVVTKSPSVGSVAEPGGDVTYTISVENTGVESVTLTDLVDDRFGDVFLIGGTSCVDNTVILPGAVNAYSCTFVGTISQSASAGNHTNTVTATVQDDETNSTTDDGSATVNVTDVAPSLTVTKSAVATIPEPGGTVTFTVTVENTGVEPVTLTDLVDDRFGDVFLIGGTSCVDNTVILPGAVNAYSCTFDESVSGNAAATHVNTVTATVEDDETNTTTANDSHTVTFTDVAPSATVTKSPSVSEVNAFGGEVTFTVTVSNTSLEALDLSALSDDVYGNIADGANPLLDSTTCSVPRTVAASGSYSCSFTITTSGTPGTTETDTVTATLADDEANSITPNDQATVRFGDAVIGDLVFLDANGDGLSTGEVGIDGITVELYDASGVTLLAGTTTAAGGSYSFTGLAAGTYVIEVVLPAGMDATPQGAGADPTIDSDIAPSGRTAAVTVAQTEANGADADGGVAPARLDGRVWLDTNADNLRPSTAGEPGIPNITVRLFDPADLVNPIATATTNVTGDYSFSGLLPADYVVDVDYPGAAYVTADQGVDTVDSDVDALGAVTVTVGSGLNPSVGDAGVVPASVGDLLFYDMNANGIQDLADTGISGGTVELYDLADTLVSSATVQGDGSYSINTVAPGDYYIVFITPPKPPAAPFDYVFTLQDQGADDADSDVDAAGRTADFSLASGGSVDLDAGAYLPTVLGDFAWLDYDGDGIQDPGEPGAPGVTVDLIDATSTVVKSTVTGVNGEWQFDQVVPGAYTIEFSLAAGTLFSPQTQGGDPALDSNVNPATATITVTVLGGVDNTLDAGIVPAVIGDFVWLDLDLNGAQDSGEAGVEGVTVELLDSSGSTVLDSTTTLADGSYEFKALSGDYRVRIVEPPGVALTARTTGTADGSDADPTTGETGVIAAGNSGTYTDEADAGLLPAIIGDFVWVDTNADGVQDFGEAARPAITVNLYESDGSTLVATTATNASGLYEFRVVPGTYVVEVGPAASGAFTVQDAGAATEATDSDVASDGRVTVAATVSGSFTDRADAGFAMNRLGDFVWVDLDSDGSQDPGEPGLDAVTVNLYDAALVFAGTTATDVNGRYEFFVMPGEYTIEVVRPTGTGFTAQDEPSAGETADSDVAPSDGRVLVDATVLGDYTHSGDAGVLPTTIGDRVWLDVDGDSLQSGSDVDLAGVTVNLYALADLVNPIATAVTGPAGDYAFAAGIGDFVVEVVPPTGASFVAQGGGTATDSDVDPGGLTSTISVTDLAVSYKDLADAGVVPAVIGDYVWFDADDDGSQDSGEPGIDSVAVRLYDPADLVNPLATTTTDPAGAYEFAVVPGTYVVEVIQPVGGAFTLRDVAAAGEAGDSDVDPADGRVTVAATTSGDHTDLADAGIDSILLGDLVWLDLDGNGAQDGGEAGVGGVTVKLYDAGDLTTPLQTAITAPNGIYGFIVLPGDYVVEVEAPPGAVFTAQDAAAAGEAADSDVDGTGHTAPISATAGPSFTASADAGLLPAVIGDFVWLDLDGDGFQGGGEVGIDGLTVNLYDPADLVTPLDITTTDVFGIYSFGVVPGTYVVEVVVPGGTFVATGPGTATDSDVDPTGSVTVPAITSGDFSGLADAGVEPATLGDFVWLDKNGNGAQDSGEPGLDGITVETRDATSTLVGTAITTAGGAYTIGGLIPGATYTVSILGPSADWAFTTQDVGGAGEAADSDVDGAGTVVVILSSGMNADAVDAGFVPGSISGTVYDDVNGNGADDGEPGIGGVTITLTGTDGLGNGVTLTTTSAGGAFSIDGLAPGTYSVTETQPVGLLDGGDSLGGSPGTLGNDAVTGIVVASGDSHSGYAFGELQPASLTGKVFIDSNNNGADDGESGLGGIDVTLTGTDDTGPIAPITLPTASDGTYTFGNLRPGTYTITEPVQPAGMIDGRDTAGSSGGDAATVNDEISGIGLAAGASGTGYLFGELEPATVAGRVFEDINGNGGDDGEPGVNNVDITLSGSDDLGAITPVTVQTGANGSYSFGNLRPGTYTITEPTQPVSYLDGPEVAGSLGGDPTSVNDEISAIPVASGDTGTGYLFAEAPPASIQGVVWLDENTDTLNGAELLLENASVEVFLATDLITPVATVSTLADGSYSATNLYPGAYVVRIAVPGATFVLGGDSEVDVTGQAAATLIGGGTAVVDAGVEPAVIGDLVWVDIDGDGVQGAEPGLGGVSIAATGTDTLANAVSTATVTASDGKYTLAVPPGDYTLTVTAPPGAGFTIQTNGTADGSDVDGSGVTPTYVGLTSGDHLDLADAGILASVVADSVWLDVNGDGIRGPSDNGITGITVELYNATNNLIATELTDTSGDYVFVNVLPGDYHVAVVYPGAVFTLSGADSHVGGSGSSPVFTVGGATTDVADAGVLGGALDGVVWLDIDGDGIQDPGEQGVSGVTVELRDGGGNLVATTATVAFGAYGFDDLVPAGGYVVTFTYPGSTFAQAGDAEADAGGVTPAFAISSGANAGSADAALVPAVLGDLVWLDVVADGIQAAGEPGIQGVTVNVYDALSTLVGSRTTDSLGAYAVPVIPGDYRVEVVPPPGGVFTVQTVATADGSDVDALGITGLSTFVSGIDGDQADAGIEPATISGTVWIDIDLDTLNDDSASVSGAVVNVYDDLGNLVATAVTNAFGMYSVAGLAPGDYTVDVIAPVGSVFTGAGGDSDVDPVTGEATVTAGSGTNSVDAGVLFGFVAGLVWFDLDGDGIIDPGESGASGITVTLLDGGGTVVGTTTTGSGGEYGFGPVPAGSYVVRVDPTPFPSGTVATFDPDGTTDHSTIVTLSGTSVGAVNFGYQPPAILSGVVFADLDGDMVQGPGELGIPGVAVVISGSASTVTVTTSAGGGYTLAVVPGAVSVDVDDSTLPPGSKLTTANDPQTVSVASNVTTQAPSVGYRPIATVSGLVWFDVNGDGIRDPGEPDLGAIGIGDVCAGNDGLLGTADDIVMPSQVTTGTGYSLAAVADQTCRFSLEMSTLPLGLTTPTFDVDAGGDASAIVPIPITGVVGVNFGVTGCGSLAGTVRVDPDGDGVADTVLAGITVVVTWLGPDGVAGTSDDVNRTVTTDVAGGYLLAGLPAGSYQVNVDPATVGARQGVAPLIVALGACQDIPVPVLDVIGAADLKVSIRPEATTVALGDELRWIVEVVNVGASDETGPIAVTVQLPPGLMFVRVDSPDWLGEVMGNGIYVFTHTGLLPIGSGLSFPIVTLVTVQGAAFTTQVAVAGVGIDINLSNNTAAALIGTLPRTGFDAGALGLIAFLLMAIGVVVLGVSRRRVD